MGNLVRTNKPILINSVDANTLKAFTDDGVSKLALQGDHGIVFNSAYLTSVVLACANSCQVDVKFLDYDPKCPCDSNCDYTGGITVRKKPKLGEEPEDYYNNKYYYNTRELNLSCNSTESIGTGSASELRTLKSDIVDQIKGHSEAFVEGGIGVKVTTVSATTEITIDGTAYGTAANAAALAVLINAGEDAYAYVDPSTSTTLWIMPYNSGDALVTTANGNYSSEKVISVSAGTGAIDSTEYIAVKSKECKDKFEIVLDNQEDADVTDVQSGVYAFLSDKEMQRKFPILPENAGENPDRPEEGADYCKLIVKAESPAYDLVGANHLNDFRGVVEIYIKKSAAESANWNGKWNIFLTTGWGVTTTWTT